MTRKNHERRSAPPVFLNHERARIVINSASNARLLLASLCLLLLAATLSAQSRPNRLAVLDFGKDPPGLHAAAAIRETLESREKAANGREFTVIDRDQASATDLDSGFDGSVN